MNPKNEAPNPFRRRPSGSNVLKLRALEAFDKRGWLNPPIWAALIGFYPARSAYSYLLHLHRFRLLERRIGANGLIVYSLSKRGKERLQWLRNSSARSQAKNQTKEAVMDIKA